MKLRKNIVDPILRGGSYFDDAEDLMTFRNWYFPVFRDRNLGFRFVMRGKP